MSVSGIWRSLVWFGGLILDSSKFPILTQKNTTCYKSDLKQWSHLFYQGYVYIPVTHGTCPLYEYHLSRSWNFSGSRFAQLRLSANPFFSFLIRRQFRSLCIGIVRNWSRSNINSNFSNAIVEFKQRKKSLFLRLIITNGTQKDDEKAKVVILSKHYPNLEIVRTFLKSWKSLKCCFIELKNFVFMFTNICSNKPGFQLLLMHPLNAIDALHSKELNW